MRILIVGAGATGGFFGSRLAEAGRDVTFLLRPGSAERIRERGLRVHAHDGEETRIEPPVVEADQLQDSYDLVLVAVKATGLASALDDVAPAVGDDTLVIPLLNGLAQIEMTQERFGAARTLGGSVQIVGKLDEAGDVVQMTSLARMTIGPLAGSELPQERARQISEALDVPGFAFTFDHDILTAMWAKWAMIASAGALCCLMRGTVGDVVAQEGGADLALNLLGEAAAVAAAYGHPLPEPNFSGSRSRLTEAGSTFTSSLYRDIVEGNPAEGEHLLGDLTARARRVGVATPLLDLATMQLRVYETRRQAEAERA